MVLAHEAGHFFTAKSFGIRVDEFGFGFPPKLFGRKYGETEYTVNMLPIGGFVKIFGEDPDDPPRLALGEAGENTTDPDENRKFFNKPAYQQAIVLFAGVFANFILAWLLFSFGLMSGLPTSLDNKMPGYTLSDVHLTIVSVVPKSPAELGGLKSGDKIVSVTHMHPNEEMHTVTNINPDSVKAFVLEHSGDEINIGYIRGKNQAINIAKVTPVLNATIKAPSIGIAMDEIGTAKLPFFTAFKEGLALTLFVTKGTVVGLYTLIRDGIQGRGSFASVTGPVGMVGIVGDAYKFGFVYLVSFTALISVNLAIINLMPFPALDGGRLFFLLIEKIKGSRINPKVANTANMIGFGILILLMLIVTYHDVVRLF